MAPEAVAVAAPPPVTLSADHTERSTRSYVNPDGSTPSTPLSSAASEAAAVAASPAHTALAAKLAAAQVQDMDGVQVRRVSEGVTFHYHVTNLREYAVRLTVTAEGTNAQLVEYAGIAARDPFAVSGLTCAATGLAVDAVIAGKSSGWFASAVMRDPKGAGIQLTTYFLVKPAVVEVRRSELRGVVLESRINSLSSPASVAYFATNALEVPVELEVSVSGVLVSLNGAPLAADANPAGPHIIKGVVPAGTHGAIPLGQLTTEGNVSHAWRFVQVQAPAVKEQASLLKGVRFVKSMGARPGEIVLSIDNTRDFAVRVTAGVEGPVVGGLTSNPMIVEVPAKASIQVCTLLTTDDVTLDWMWDRV